MISLIGNTIDHFGPGKNYRSLYLDMQLDFTDDVIHKCLFMPEESAANFESIDWTSLFHHFWQRKIKAEHATAKYNKPFVEYILTVHMHMIMQLHIYTLRRIVHGAHCVRLSSGLLGAISRNIPSKIWNWAQWTQQIADKQVHLYLFFN